VDVDVDVEAAADVAVALGVDVIGTTEAVPAVAVAETRNVKVTGLETGAPRRTKLLKASARPTNASSRQVVQLMTLTALLRRKKRRRSSHLRSTWRRRVASPLPRLHPPSLNLLPRAPARTRAIRSTSNTTSRTMRAQWNALPMSEETSTDPTVAVAVVKAVDVVAVAVAMDAVVAVAKAAAVVVRVVRDVAVVARVVRDVVVVDVAVVAVAAARRTPHSRWTISPPCKNYLLLSTLWVSGLLHSSGRRI